MTSMSGLARRARTDLIVAVIALVANLAALVMRVAT